MAVYCYYYLALGVLMFITSYLQVLPPPPPDRLDCLLRVRGGEDRSPHATGLSPLDPPPANRVVRQPANGKTHGPPLRVSFLERRRVGSDLERVREGLGDKLSLFLQNTSAALSGMFIGLFYDWR